MAAPSGHSKWGGRKKGAKNKKTTEQKERIEKVIGYLEESLYEDIKALTQKERAYLWADLQEYVRPKLARTELTGRDGKRLVETHILYLPPNAGK